MERVKRKPVLAICLFLLLGVLATLLLRLPAQANARAREQEQVQTQTRKKNKYGFDDNILLSVFYPFEYSYLSGGEGDERWDEQFKLLADADIDYLGNAHNGAGMDGIDTNHKMAEYAHKYGMLISVSDERFGSALLGKSEEEIAALVNEYKNVPGVGGYYILDEPMHPNEYAKVYEYLKKADPEAYMHLNFLPYYVYDDLTHYESKMHDWVKLNAASGYKQDYLMYDLYPYPDSLGGMNRIGFFSNLSAAWRVGLANDVKTANYLQSMRIPGHYRSPSVSEIRYEMMVSLAYGFKQLSYFTWFTPGTGHSETFADGVIEQDGTPNPKTYTGICALNKEVHALGKTLINLDAKEVYLNGETWEQPSVPDDFLLQPTDNALYTVSYMRDKDTGRNYFMIVNNDIEKACVRR